MVEVQPIPVELETPRLSETSGASGPEAERFMDTARPFIEPVGVFDEMAPDGILPPELTAMDWGPTVMAGLIVFTNTAVLPDPENRLWRPLLTLAAEQALAFLEYRVRLYLKPDHRRPSERLIPGCPALPLSVNAAIWRHFHPDHTHGLDLMPDGRFCGREGVAFLYPTSELVFRSKCDACTLAGCPSRQGWSS